MPKYWRSEVRQSAGVTDALYIYSLRNDHSRAIRVHGCSACSSGALGTTGLHILRERNGKFIPVYFSGSTLAANVTASPPVPFLLLPGERIAAWFDKPAATTDILQLVAFGEYVEVLD